MRPHVPVTMIQLRKFTIWTIVVLILFVVLSEVEARKKRDVGVCPEMVTVPKTKWVNGSRVQYKAKVEKRACCQGWYFNRKDKTCKAVCDMGCKNGRCVAPNDCRCDPPYILKDHECVMPTCKDPCVNAKCVDTNVCACNPEFERINSTHCAANCPTGLINDPHTLNCTCKSGYKFDPENETKCLPICDPECVNANCAAPNTCSCLTGYEYAGNNSTCVPKCDDCENGICIAPNDCKCNNGYTKNIIGKCVAFCSKPCTNGHCHEPEICGCDSGFAIDNYDKYTCRPVCKTKCVNGTCVAPNKCSCLSGYEESSDSNVCRPKCSSCEHGDCVAPELCRCHNGYITRDGICRPYCQQVCVNGDCVAPDSCDCNPGYMNNSTAPHVCYKPCSGPCLNGDCSLDGVCLCNRGYALEGDNCVPIAPVDCATCNGSCTEESCWCLDGMPCFIYNPESAVATTATLAGLELSWVLAGAAVIVLMVLAVVVLQRIWKKNRKTYEHKAPGLYHQSSVLYTVPDTLKRVDASNKDKYTYAYNEKNEDTTSQYENVTEEEEATERLFTGQDNVYRSNVV